MIIFEKIKYQNFLSVGNSPIELDLNVHPSLLFRGKNGQGKSILIDALTFGLFGKSFRGINKPNLVNSINQKDCLVEIWFTIGKKHYSVVRGIKPNVFDIYCDGNLVPQDSRAKDYQEQFEKFILKMNYKSFTQIVVLGTSSFVPFMKLPAADRRNIIEELLDIQIFSSMNIVLKQRLLDLADSINEVKQNLGFLEVKIKASEKVIDEIKNHNNNKITNNEQEIDKTKISIETLTQDLESLSKEIAKLSDEIGDKEKERAKLKQLSKLEAQLENNRNKITKEIQFLDDNDICPTCQQDIAPEFKKTKQEAGTAKQLEIDEGIRKLMEKIHEANEYMNRVNEIEKKIVHCNSEVVKRTATIAEMQKYINKLSRENDEIQNNAGDLDKEIQHKKDLLVEQETQREKSKSLMNDKHYYDMAARLLKDDGIKTKIIRQYIPTINKLVNKYLATMDFFVNFMFDENFNETIKSRHRDDFSYENFSQGERQKIDLALLFTWRAVAKLKNSVNTNLLVLDETFDSSLDADATEGLMKILNTLGPETNLIVMSHRGDLLQEKFKNHLTFEKVGNFTKVS